MNIKLCFQQNFAKVDEDDHLLDEIELYITMNSSQKLAESDIENVNIISQVEHQIQNQEIKDSGWIFKKIISMEITFCNTNEMIGSIPFLFRSSAILIFENDDKDCFLWSIIASSHPCENIISNSVSN